MEVWCLHRNNESHLKADVALCNPATLWDFTRFRQATVDWSVPGEPQICEKPWPDSSFDFTQARQGAVIPPATGTTRIVVDLDADLLAWIDTHLTAQGGGTVSTCLHEALAQYKATCEEG